MGFFNKASMDKKLQEQLIQKKAKEAVKDSKPAGKPAQLKE